MVTFAGQAARKVGRIQCSTENSLQFRQQDISVVPHMQPRTVQSPAIMQFQKVPILWAREAPQEETIDIMMSLPMRIQ